MHRRSLSLIGVAALTASLLAGCGSSDSGSGSGGNTVRIGQLAELTGGAASFGLPQANGIQLAVDEINAAGGFDVGGTKHTIELDTQDNKSDATAGVTALQKIRSDGAKYLVGTGSSAVLGAYLPIVKDDQNFISLVVGAALVGATDNVSIYRPRVTLTQYTAATLQYLQEKKLTKLALLSDSQHAGYVAETPTYLAGLEAAGIEVLAQESYKLGDTDFAAQLTAMLRTDPEVLSLRGYAPDTARIVKQARELGYDGPIVTNAGLSKTEVTDAQAGDSMTDVVDIVAPTSLDLVQNDTYKAAAEAFNTAYEAKFKEEPGFTSASAYSGVKILVAAMQKAGTVTDVPKVREALDALTPADVTGLVDSVKPNAEGKIFTNHQAAYEMVVRAYDPADQNFHAVSFVAGT
ncbi:ABC transporter substrate-binding protein [Nakamurella sp. YIM 132087]|uniref:ABC transporter substrate-binding protein n=1 Tax=Nakamurella alba TaxID=2665158 RepID=A0A7K1FKZ6_9ACTN|nr:ABC transporter substrate-binding protein [Nakamurella alba]MTD13903.1 ABC transporter substrate-binding protein [Nakamurella alba]